MNADLTTTDAGKSTVSPSRSLLSALWLKVRAHPERVLTPLAFVLFILTWRLITVSGLLSTIILPPVEDVVEGLGFILTSTFFPKHLSATLQSTLSGFFLGSLVAFTLGLLMDELPGVRRVIYPYIVTLQLLPLIVLVPVFVIWFGYGIQSKIAIAIVSTFFVVLVNTLAGLASVDERSLLLLKSLSASRWQVFRMLKLPSALPFVFAGLRTGVTSALGGALVAEFMTAQVGLGTMLTSYSFSIKQDMVFATVVIIVALGLIGFGIVSLLERRIVWWHAPQADR